MRPAHLRRRLTERAEPRALGEARRVEFGEQRVATCRDDLRPCRRPRSCSAVSSRGERAPPRTRALLDDDRCSSSARLLRVWAGGGETGGGVGWGRPEVGGVGVGGGKVRLRGAAAGVRGAGHARWAGPHAGRGGGASTRRRGLIAARSSRLARPGRANGRADRRRAPTRQPPSTSRRRRRRPARRDRPAASACSAGRRCPIVGVVHR